MWKHRNIKPIFFGVWILLIILSMLSTLSIAYSIVWALLYFGVLVYASFDIRLGYFIRTHCSHKKEKDRRVAITFDDGPTEHTSEVLDMLSEYNVKATFFLIGKQVLKYPTLAKRILAEGHTIGNHTMNHSKKFGFLRSSHVVQEINSCDAVLYDHLLKKVRFFRPPFGVTNPSIAKAVKETGDIVIGWNNRSLDTVLHHSETIYQRIIKKIKPGDIILLHDTSEKSVAALKKLLDYMVKENYSGVTVDELLNLEAYEF